jgi:hypothetical protein
MLASSSSDAPSEPSSLQAANRATPKVVQPSQLRK